MELQLKSVFKSLFLSKKKKNFLCVALTLIPYFKLNDPFFCWLLFFKICFKLQVRINKIADENGVSYHPSPSGSGSKIHISVTFLGIYLSPEILLNLSLKVHIPP